MADIAGFNSNTIQSEMPFSFKPAIPPGSRVLVTAVNSYIGSHVAHMLLDLGYKVRGAGRDFDRCRWVIQRFEGQYDKEAFEFVAVENMSSEGAYDKSLSGIAGVIHVASPTQFSSDPNEIIPTATNGVLSVLESTLQQKSVLRFVLTSSSVAVLEPSSQSLEVTSEMWNEEAVHKAWAPPPYLQERAMAVYAASKVRSEQAMWDWLARKDPSFKANSVIPSFVFGRRWDWLARKDPSFKANSIIPSFVFGRPLDVQYQGYPSSSGIPIVVYDNDPKKMAEFIDNFPPFFFVDVEDVARLHIAALLHPEVANERLFAFAGPFNRNDLIRTLQHLFPDRQFPEEFPSSTQNESKILPAKRAEDLLKQMWGKGFSSLDDSLRANLEEYF
ncbi:aldehyde reductase II [Penicillium mononematosum]|uniref:aldehyde reductase II n=1 Tax=Penicillium mononematosum TaxID=268346 RepID=UPI0025471ED9|nr:aldehyde reductase II [Penicillium mononematosum]KAJ6191294.1 aldehyde reductase II [Penicillium mononematosum]